MKVVIRVLAIVFVLAHIAAIGVGYWIWTNRGNSNPFNYKTIGDIPTPWGYERTDVEGNDFGTYLRSLPLKERGTLVNLYTGGIANLQSLCYAVIDMPILSNDEQCADVCMHLRAEYLYETGNYSNIHFNSVDGKRMNYNGGADRSSYERYMRRVYGVASTYSLSRELPVRKLSDIQVGDVFVYAAVDRGKYHKYGHAVMVVDVATDKNGNKVFMLAEGNTPARDMHVLKNWFNPIRSPWFTLNEDADGIWLSPFHYKSNELHYWE